MITLPNPFLGDPEIFQNKAPSVKQSNKIKKAGFNGTLIVPILDESGSMSHLVKETIDGFNEFVGDQKSSKDKDEDIFFTTVKFEGGNVVTLYDHKHINHLAPLSAQQYNPCGSTNLLDAVGQTVNRVNGYLKTLKKKERPSVLFVIFTDGGENSSEEYNFEQVKELVGDCESQDWGFTFFGANIDAFSTGNSFGMNSATTVQYDTRNTGATYATASVGATRFRDMKKAGMTTEEVYTTGLYNDDDRSSTVGDE
tara:strand:- start:3534 stop:4295 length:762 start_codon:yes stop_codon:yes gene_type:complete